MIVITRNKKNILHVNVLEVHLVHVGGKNVRSYFKTIHVRLYPIQQEVINPVSVALSN